MEHTYDGMHASHTPRTDHAMVLGDGRALQVAEWGPEDGRPVVVLHGTPGSRLFCPDPVVVEAAGVRMVAFDRPGYGRSDPARRPLRHADVASDVVELLDLLGIERAPIIGWSGGGPYALACGVFASERVTSVAAVCSPGEPATERDIPPEVLALRRQVAADPEAHRDVVRARSAWLGDDLTEVVAEMVAEYPEVFAIPGMRDAATAEAREAAAVGLDGYIDDFIGACLGWGFDLADIKVPVCSWYGEQDTIIGAHHAALLAARIPDCRSLGSPECGHFIAMAHWSEILAELR
jgi:pimeloyl-ACP methyl ester carboxylesterase